MKATKFLIQLDESTLLPSMEGLAVIEQCKFQNWYNNDSLYEIYFGFIGRDRVYSSVNNAARDHRVSIGYIDYSEMIPVGSIEFVEHIKGKLCNSPIKVINVPDELNKYIYTSRNCRVVDTNTLLELREALHSEAKNVIVKPATLAKSFETSSLDSLNIEKVVDTKCFISDRIDIITEWRVFVLNKRIIGIKKYLGQNGTPNLDFIESCILAYSDSPKAYTLDVCRTMDGKDAVLEVHNFVSCGTYGLNEPKLLAMYKAGWKYELDRGD